MTELMIASSITDPTAISCKKKFLAFIDDLSNKYPPMTFQEYKNADGNHTNWFPQRYEQTTASMYKEWFICAVLNNSNFYSLVYKRRDVDATKIFTEMINNDDFRRYCILCPDNNDGLCIYILLLNFVKFPLQKHGRVEINYDSDFNLYGYFDYFDEKFQHGNINSVSSNIRINKLNAMTKDDIESNDDSEIKCFIYDARNKHAAPLHSEDVYLSSTQIDYMYMIQVKSDSTIEFIYLKECYVGYNRPSELNPTATFSLLMENIRTILE